MGNQPGHRGIGRNGLRFAIDLDLHERIKGLERRRNLISDAILGPQRNTVKQWKARGFILKTRAMSLGMKGTTKPQ